jgi:hypothetical protein
MREYRAYLAWHPGVGGQLRLRLGERCAAVPGEVVDALLAAGRPGLTVDPALDLLMAESRWRLRAASLADTTTRARQATMTAFADLYAMPDTPPLVFAAERRRLSLLLAYAVDELVAGARAVAVARHRIQAVRDYVIGLDVPHGLLAGARAGWQRNPARPDHVSTFPSEGVFVTADPRRANPDTSAQAGWASPIAGEVFGVAWRRDGDDDDPYTDEPAVLGPWQLGYIPATGEIYASRRCHYRDPQVWLLADGHTDPDRTRRLLSDLKPRMGEPNSLLLAAHTATHDVVNDVPQRGEG